MNTIQIDLPAPGRILIVDDEPKNRELLHDLLEFNGYSVIEAEDGLTALELAISAKCDVILLDVIMPRMDGLEACKRLKSNPATAHIPVLMVSALTDREQRDMGIEAGANDYLTKPIDRRDVLLRVRNAVHAKHLFDKVQSDLAKLRELDILQDNLTHMIVHDMRSPLMVVAWSYDLILKEPPPLSPKQLEYITMGQHCCTELVEMVRSLLDVSRLEAGQMPLNRTPCNLRDIAEKAVESVALLSLKKKLSVTITGIPIVISADSDILHRIFVNLLGNAIKYSPDDSTITIDIRSTGQTVRTTMTDQGPGIPQDFQKKIFEKFGQVNSHQEGQVHSSGLGLTFCKLAVEAHGGSIGVVSPASSFLQSSPDASAPTPQSAACSGSTFWILLPIC